MLKEQPHRGTIAYYAVHSRKRFADRCGLLRRTSGGMIGNDALNGDDHIAVIKGFGDIVHCAHTHRIYG